MITKRVELPDNDNDSAFSVDSDASNDGTPFLITLESIREIAQVYATPANLRAIAAACVEAADELEGK